MNSLSTTDTFKPAETGSYEDTVSAASKPKPQNTEMKDTPETNTEPTKIVGNSSGDNTHESKPESNLNPVNGDVTNTEVTKIIGNSSGDDTHESKPEFNLNPVNGEVAAAANNGSTNACDDEPDCGLVSSDDGQSEIESKSSLSKPHKANSSVHDVKPKAQNKGFRKSVSSLFSCVGDRAVDGVHTIDNILDTFIPYNQETLKSRRPHGRGICVIFTLFTGDSIGQGYIADRNHLRDFFGKKLDYKVFCDGNNYVNVTRERLLKSLAEIQTEIADKAQKYEKPYDRFVLVILTHGEKNGLLTCSNKQGKHEELHTVDDGKGNSSLQRVYTKVEEICSMFKHDQVPDLKGKPKLFLVQACRGWDTVRAASGSDQQISYDLGKLKLKPEVPIDADQIVFYAATPDYQSYVAPSGSWFIDTTLNVFKRHYEGMHVEDMMTIINFVIASKQGKEQDGPNNYKLAVQMTCKHSTLRMKFYL